ncbi:MAG: hypothetical protein P8Y58_17320, partial [Novosphingobium sp.]
MATAASSYLNRSTPGIYITEKDAFGTSIVGVATAVPIFIGYTEFAGDPQTGKSLYNTPYQISSMTEFNTYFGGPAVQGYSVSQMPPPATPSGSGSVAAVPTPSFVADYTTADPSGSQGASGAGMAVKPTGFMLAPTALPDEPNQFNLYWQMRLFFANGGGDCFIVSVGSYWANEFPTSKPDPVPDDWFAGSIAAGDPSTPGDAGLLVGLNAASYA